jgi:hypothetical protein
LRNATATHRTRRTLKPWAAEIVRDLDTYTETSPSRTGVKLYLLGTKPGTSCKKPYDDGEIEVYDRGRFFAMTGTHWPGTPTTVEPRQQQLEALYRKVFGDDPPQPAPHAHEANGTAGRHEQADTIPDAAAAFLDATAGTALPAAAPPDFGRPFTDAEVLEHARAARDGAKFTSLELGNVADYQSQSEADEAYCYLLAFWTRRDAAQTDRLFRASGLMRAKWDEKHGATTYGERTIQRALDKVSAVYTGTHPTPTVPTNGTATAAKQPQPEAPHDRPLDFALGDVTLRLENVRRTPTKVTASVAVRDADGNAIGRLSFSDSATGQTDAAKQLRKLAPSTDPAPVVSRLLAAASAAADRQAAAAKTSVTVAAVIGELVPPRFAFKFRTDKGTAYSETRGAEVAHGEFVRYLPAWLRKACERAADCPPSRIALFRLMSAELGSLWSSLLEALPTEDQANVGPDSPAARRFRGELEKVLCYPTTFEVANTSTATPAVYASKTSCLELVREQAAAYREHERERRRQARLKNQPAPRGRQYWQRVRKSYDVWWRILYRRGHKPAVLIGLRHRIGYQTQAMRSLPGVFDQESFRRQADRSGILAAGIKVLVVMCPAPP